METLIPSPSGHTNTKRLLDVLSGKPVDRAPFWFMRQAGRYLPEYRALRARAGSFLDLAYTPDFAVEVTLQPIRRFHPDAAILFSDILVVPHALGQDLAFREGEGPVLDPVAGVADLTRLSVKGFHDHLKPVYETVARLREALPDDVALIGFAGAPWTVATYMVAGRGTSDQAPAKAWAYGDSEGFQALIDLLVESTGDYLERQVEAGAETVQIFDTWAGSLPPSQFARWVIEPTKAIVRRLKQRFPNVPVIGFPRGAGPLYVRYVRETGVDAVGIDTALPADWAAEHLSPLAAVQGNLDPQLVVAGGAAMDDDVERIQSAFRGCRHIFNLGHGFVPNTPVAHVEALVRRLKGGEE
ncbi:MAG: uroporphyrinogen decarboxylase [Alphaproteobacteria bacterium]|nr:MAG: uroporphyrinogen decarboxylase [Alphaproteobacteria bacterium]